MRELKRHIQVWRDRNKGRPKAGILTPLRDYKDTSSAALQKVQAFWSGQSSKPELSGRDEKD